jgi:hypothetical protein
LQYVLAFFRLINLLISNNLFFSGREHPAEHQSNVLSGGESFPRNPIQMCDALSRNAPSEFDTIVTWCTTFVYANRHFVDAAMNFREEYRVDGRIGGLLDKQIE